MNLNENNDGNHNISREELLQRLRNKTNQRQMGRMTKKNREYKKEQMQEKINKQLEELKINHPEYFNQNNENDSNKLQNDKPNMKGPSEMPLSNQLNNDTIYNI